MLRGSRVAYTSYPKDLWEGLILSQEFGLDGPMFLTSRYSAAGLAAFVFGTLVSAHWPREWGSSLVRSSEVPAEAIQPYDARGRVR